MGKVVTSKDALVEFKDGAAINEGNVEFVELVRAVVLGTHGYSNKELQKVFEKYRLLSFSFAEYFFDTPVRSKDDLKHASIYLPFLESSARNLTFRVHINGKSDAAQIPDGKVTLLAPDQLCSFISPKTTEYLKRVRQEAQRPVSSDNFLPQLRVSLESYVDGLQNAKSIMKWEDRFIGLKLPDGSMTIEHGGLQVLRKTDSFVPFIKDSNASQESFISSHITPAILSYETQIHPMFMDGRKDSKVYILRLAISSGTTMYGYLAISFRDYDTGNGINDEPLDLTSLSRELKESLNSLVEERYLPALILLHTSIIEKRIAAKLDKLLLSEEGIVEETIMSQAYTELSQEGLVYKGWEESKNVFEFSIASMNLGRSEFLDPKFTGRPDASGSDCVRSVRESIILHKYQLASKSMIGQLKKLILGARLMSLPIHQGQPLPSALVYGEAGSGKDQFARLFYVFSPSYRDFLGKSVDTINMASVKPAGYAVPHLFGVALGLLDSNANKNQEGVGGIAGVISRHGKYKFEDWKRSAVVFIFDELNSLDYEVQGSLLRLLENGEAIQLFGGVRSYVRGLVVGVVNEDPNEVTREKELSMLKKATEFLGQSEVAKLYEAFISARRLRPDLVYRLQRGANIRLPSLAERREDIPLLFRSFICSAVAQMTKVGEQNLRKDVEIAFDAYQMVMNEHIEWPGNVRQLQAVAYEVAERAINLQCESDDGERAVSISAITVEDVLNEEKLIRFV